MKYNFNEDVLNINLDEELDMNTCKTLRTVIDGYIMRYQPKEFVFDLSEVKFEQQKRRYCIFAISSRLMIIC